jgi:hypothetical protein
MLPVTIDMEVHKRGVRLRVRYNGALFHESTIARLIKVMLSAQEALVKDDTVRLSSITW